MILRQGSCPKNENHYALRVNALKLLERNGFDYDLAEDLKGYVVQLSKHAKYAQILKNSVVFKETANERIFRYRAGKMPSP